MICDWFEKYMLASARGTIANWSSIRKHDSHEVQLRQAPYLRQANTAIVTATCESDL